jgi:hypothetical protein
MIDFDVAFFSEAHASGNCRSRKLQMEETEVDDTDSFSSSVKVKAKRILSRAKVSVIFLDPIIM